MYEKTTEKLTFSISVLKLWKTSLLFDKVDWKSSYFSEYIFSWIKHHTQRHYPDNKIQIQIFSTQFSHIRFF